MTRTSKECSAYSHLGTRTQHTLDARQGQSSASLGCEGTPAQTQTPHPLPQASAAKPPTPLLTGMATQLPADTHRSRHPPASPRMLPGAVTAQDSPPPPLVQLGSQAEGRDVGVLSSPQPKKRAGPSCSLSKSPGNSWVTSSQPHQGKTRGTCAALPSPPNVPT